jgi:hypothetical protein
MVRAVLISALGLSAAISGGTRASAASFYFLAHPAADADECAAPCYEILAFYEDATRGLDVSALQFGIDLFGGATPATLPVPPETNSNARGGNVTLEDEEGDLAELPWDLASIVGKPALPMFDALIVDRASLPLDVASVQALRDWAAGCTPELVCTIQSVELANDRILLGSFNATWDGGAVGVRVGGITGDGPGVTDPDEGVQRLEDAVFVVDGFGSADQDEDGVVDLFDNCPSVPNAGQADTDSNGVGDACNSGEDADGDDWADDLDNCPDAANADQADRDLDLHGDRCDLCPDYGSAGNADFDANGIGDPCECGDQTQDAVVNVLDLIAINLAIFGAVQVSPLCDGNYDGLCDVSDIVAANAKIFGQPAYCSRYPRPQGPGATH